MKKLLLFIAIVVLTGCSEGEQQVIPSTKQTYLSIADSTYVTDQALKTIYHFETTGDMVLAKDHIDSAKQRLVDAGFGESAAMASMLNLEAVYWQNRYYNRDTAIILLTQAIDMAEQEVGAESTELCDMLVNLSVMHREKMEFEKAEHLLLDALSRYGGDSAKFSTEMILTLVNLGTTYTYWKKHELALPQLYKALEISTREFGKNHVRTAEVISHIAGLTEDMGNADRAVKYRLETIAIYESLDPIPKDRLRSAYANLGAVYANMGRADDAIAFYTKAEPFYEGSGARIATIWDNMASVYRTQEPT